MGMCGATSPLNRHALVTDTIGTFDGLFPGEMDCMMACYGYIGRDLT